jgi:hypothetical protein
MEFLETKYTPVTINGLFKKEDDDSGSIYRFENKEAFRLTDGGFAVISDVQLADGGVYSEAIKVFFLADDWDKLTSV